MLDCFIMHIITDILPTMARSVYCEKELVMGIAPSGWQQRFLTKFFTKDLKIESYKP